MKLKIFFLTHTTVQKFGLEMFLRAIMVTKSAYFWSKILKYCETLLQFKVIFIFLFNKK